MELAECKQCVVEIILPKWLGHFGSSLNHQFFAKLLQMIFSVPYKQPSPYVGVSNWWGASDASATRDAYTSRPWIGGWISDMEAPDKSAVWWFQLEIQPDECPWAFVDGDSTRRIASLEMLSTLVFAALLIQRGSSTLLRLQLALISDNQGNVFALLNQNTRKMPTAAFLMQLVHLLYDRGAQLAPNHCKRDHNQWADELTHPAPVGFTPQKRLSLHSIFALSFCHKFCRIGKLLLFDAGPCGPEGMIASCPSPPNPPMIPCGSPVGTAALIVFDDTTTDFSAKLWQVV